MHGGGRRPRKTALNSLQKIRLWLSGQGPTQTSYVSLWMARLFPNMEMPVETEVEEEPDADAFDDFDGELDGHDYLHVADSIV